MRTSTWLFVVLACIGICGCDEEPAGQAKGETKEEKQVALIERVDKHGDELMAGDKKAEAREWLKSDNHILFKANRKKLAQFVEDFYGAGATQVLMVDLEDHEGKQFAEAMLVVLPADTAARAKLFQVNDRASEAYEEDPIVDKGQKYLYYGLD